MIATESFRRARAVALAELHASRTHQEMDRVAADVLVGLLPGVDLALAVADEAAGSLQLRFAVGANCPVRGRARIGSSDWSLPPAQRLPIRFRTLQLGELWLGQAPGPEALEAVQEVLVHYGTALVGLTLQAESRQATEDYCASLQALEEGIVLFQEEDPAAVMARLLHLASSMVRATAGALYVLREVGRVDSGLQLEQALGIPESMLATFRGVDGCHWPEVLLDQPAQVAVRDAAAEAGTTGGMAMLAPDCVPPVLRTIVVLPLRYHGVQAGVCLLFNPLLDSTQPRDFLGRLQTFGQLAAALLHRLSLEALTASSRAITRELEIAETIQKQLVPTAAPPTDEYEFAWSTIAAKNIGGDYVDVVGSMLGDIYAVIADASGHGINSALLTASFRSNYRGNAPWNDPDEVASALNREIVREVGPTGMFITATLLRFEQESRRLSVCGAGHNPTLIYRAATGRIDAIDAHGPPMGFVADVAYTRSDTVMAPGDVLLLYTDGVTEAANADLDMYGEERLRGVLLANATRTPGEIVAAVRAELVAFTGGRERYEDDVTMLVARAR